MDKIHQVFFTLLRLGLWKNSTESFSIFPLKELEWEKLFALSIQQAVEGIIFNSFSKLSPNDLPSKALLLKWTVRVDSIERYNQTIQNNTKKLAKLYNQNQVSFFLLKGYSLGRLYDTPNLRSSGDIDLYFPKISCFKSANQLIQSKNILVEKGSLKSSFFTLNNTVVEHHVKLFDILNPFCSQYLANLIKEESKNSIQLSIDEVTVPTISYLLAHVQTNAHILKHYLGYGIGIRQFCDLARLYYHSKNSIDSNQLMEIYKKLKIYNWVDDVNQFLVKYIGLEPQYLPFEYNQNTNTNIDWLLNDILQAGNFGLLDMHTQQDNSIILKDGRNNKLFKQVVPHLFKASKKAPIEAALFPFIKINDLLF
ncbi:nucleotidyltransferase family protein [Sphingobacterium sp. HJSM2_6]|uniref:nucleotidyltransferase family protein n=1 Tax=Sphingobacterium sp. HJSM2_6 TaxID=3366264 RepID=UPI003BE00425